MERGAWRPKPVVNPVERSVAGQAHLKKSITEISRMNNPDTNLQTLLNRVLSGMNTNQPQKVVDAACSNLVLFHEQIYTNLLLDGENLRRVSTALLSGATGHKVKLTILTVLDTILTRLQRASTSMIRKLFPINLVIDFARQEVEQEIKKQDSEATEATEAPAESKPKEPVPSSSELLTLALDIAYKFSGKLRYGIGEKRIYQ